MANLKGANLSKADIRVAGLTDTKLEWANLRGANLKGAGFNRARMQRTNLTEANLFEACLGEAWLIESTLERANLNQAFLNRAILFGANLIDAKLNPADLSDADLRTARFYRADLKNAYLFRANLQGAYFEDADLSMAKLCGANLSRTNLTNANLTKANFNGVVFVETILKGAVLSESNVYGSSAWNIKTNLDTQQNNLVITEENKPVITVDNIEVAQFVYLLLNNQKIRDVINTVGEKGVLILGRFSEERKAILDAMREKLRELGFVPMMFDFEKPTQRDFTETIKTLAGLSRFIIADITNPKSSPLELQATMPDYMIPFVPIIQEDEEPFAMFRDLQQKYGDWVLDVLRYDSADNLLMVLDEAVIKPALKKADELLIKKAEGIRDRHVKDYM
jgi:uncharacterized protein YjbI with pentapeptide repeats